MTDEQRVVTLAGLAEVLREQEGGRDFDVFKAIAFDLEIDFDGWAAAIFAALPAAPALDVERLARAIDEWWEPVREHVAGAGTYTVTLDPPEVAKAIAAAYDADKEAGLP